MRATLLGVIGLVCVATAAQGQLVGLNHVWTVPGVMNTGTGLHTIIRCSNSSTSTQAIGVDVYGPGGSHVTGNSLSVAPNATVVFATDDVANIAVDIDLNTGTLTKGNAWVMATGTKGVLCSAFLVNSSNGIPTATLTIAKKTKQKGD